MALCVMSAAPCGRALAQQGKVIELTYGTAFSADHTFSRADQKWIAKIEKDTNGRVKIKPYWGGQVIGGTNAVDELAAGVADIAYINPANTKTGFTLCKSMQLFFAGANVETGLRVFQQLRAKFPEIDKEYADAKVKPLQVSGSTQTLLTRKPIRKLDDLKGTRIRCVGDWTKAIEGARIGRRHDLHVRDVYRNAEGAFGRDPWLGGGSRIPEACRCGKVRQQL